MSWAQRARSVVHPDQRSNPLCEPILRAGRLAGTIAKRAHRGSHDERGGRGGDGKPASRLSLLGSRFPICRHGKGAVSLPSGISRHGRSLRRGAPRFPPTTAARGAVRRGRRPFVDPRNGVYAACSLCCTGCAHGFVALMGRGSRCCVGPQRRRVCRGLLRRGLHARGLSEVGSRSRKADAGSSAPRDHGLDLRRRSDRGQGDRATQFEAHRHRGAERAGEYGDLWRSRSGPRDNGEPQRRRRSVSAINGLACVSFAFDPAGN